MFVALAIQHAMHRRHIVIVTCDVVHATLHITRNNTPIHNILSTALLCISQTALGTFPEDGNITPKHVGATTHN
jgi:hypothetical protein